jgi:hypothetical protein
MAYLHYISNSSVLYVVVDSIWYRCVFTEISSDSTLEYSQSAYSSLTAFVCICILYLVIFRHTLLYQDVSEALIKLYKRLLHAED